MNYPLGHTSGRPHDLPEQVLIISSALALLESATRPGEIVSLDLEWPSPWKEGARSRGDSRTVRHNTPQWERPSDTTR